MASGLTKLLTVTATALDRRFGWDRLPRPLGVLTLAGLRTAAARGEPLRHGHRRAARRRPDGVPTRTARTLDGTYNDLGQPAMGAIGARFGRNVPLERTYPEQRRRSSSRTRASSAASCSRARVHPADDAERPRRRLAPVRGARLVQPRQERARRAVGASRSPTTTRGPSSRCGSRARARPDPFPDDDAGRRPASPPTAHWWDGSQIYGSEPAFATRAPRGRGRQAAARPGRPAPARPRREHVDLTGVAGELLGRARAPAHALHARAQRDLRPAARRASRPGRTTSSSTRARLVNAALMAKIHTVEWTPAIIAHPTTQLGDARELVGPPRRALQRRVGRLGSSEVLERHPRLADEPPRRPVLADRGVRRRLPHAPAPARRLHVPLARDGRRGACRSGRSRRSRVHDTRDRLEELGVANALYSFGVAHPGAITLHNYPRFLQSCERAGRHRSSTSPRPTSCAIRERGVPRYNDFRQLFHLKPAATFEELTDNPQ